MTSPDLDLPERHPDPAATLARAASLQNAVETLGNRIATIGTQGRQNRTVIHWLIVSLVFDITLSILLGVVAVRANTASTKASQATSAARLTANNQAAACQAANKTAAGNEQVWTYLLTLPAAGPVTAGQADQLAKFRVYINGVFAQQICAVSSR